MKRFRTKRVLGFDSRVDAGSREENASNQTHRARRLILSQAERLQAPALTERPHAVPQDFQMSPFTTSGTIPMLQRRPYAPGQAETIDRRGGAERSDSVQFDAGPLEAALLQHVARGRIDHTRAG